MWFLVSMSMWSGIPRVYRSINNKLNQWRDFGEVIGLRTLLTLHLPCLISSMASSVPNLGVYNFGIHMN